MYAGNEKEMGDAGAVDPDARPAGGSGAGGV
jgi:hypothetical protein